MHIDLDIAAIQPAKLCKSLLKSCNPRLPLRVITGPHQHSDVSYSLRLLRPRCERPRSRPAEQRHEVAPFHQQFSRPSKRKVALGETYCTAEFRRSLCRLGVIKRLKR